MKRLAPAIACLAIALAAAAEPERLAEARAMMKAMQVDKQMDLMVNTMSAQMARQTNELGGGSDPRVAIIGMEEAMSVMRERAMSPGGLFDNLADAYAGEFTLEELRQIRAFHESDVGRRVRDAAPRLVQRVFERTPIMSKDTLLQVCLRVRARLQREDIPEGNSKSCPEAAK